MTDNPIMMLDIFIDEPPRDAAQIVRTMRRLPAGTWAKCQCGMYTAANDRGYLVLYRHHSHEESDHDNLCGSLSVHYD